MTFPKSNILLAGGVHLAVRLRKGVSRPAGLAPQVQQQIVQVIEFTCGDFWNCHNIRRFKQALRRPGLRRGTVAPAWFEWFR